MNVIAEILPSTVVVEALRGDPAVIALFPEEQALLARAVQKRRREFATARLCARRALSRLDLPLQPILTGARGEPLWPAGVVGSITHCAGYRACALARTADMLAIGIDAEPHSALPDGVLALIAGPQERHCLRQLACVAPHVHWDRLLFSAKESIYKAWYPLSLRRLGFEDAVLTLDPGVGTSASRASAGTFSARLQPPGLPVGSTYLTTLPGRWLVRDGFVLTALALPSQETVPLFYQNPV